MRHLLSIVLIGCGVELGEPPDVDDDDRDDGKGDGHHDDDDDDDTRLSARAFLSRIGVEYCDESFRCKTSYPDGATAFSEDFGETKQACYAGVDDYYGAALVEQSIAAGRVVYSAAKAKACLDGISYPPQCGSFWQTEPVFPSACEVALVGKIADGGTCVSIFDCASSLCDPMTKRCTPQ